MTEVEVSARDCEKTVNPLCCLFVGPKGSFAAHDLSQGERIDLQNDCPVFAFSPHVPEELTPAGLDPRDSDRSR